MIIDYDRELLERQLNDLHPDLRTVFAAACAERLLPSHYSAQESERVLPEKAIAALWNSLIDNSITESQLRLLAEACDKLITMDNEHERDAVVAISYALESKWKGEGGEAQCAAERAYEAIDAFVMAKESDGIVTKEMNRRVLAHPLVQAELLRQRRDIGELLNAGSEDIKTVAIRFRDRAKEEAKFFFGTKEPKSYREN